MANALLGALVDGFTSTTLNTALWNETSGGGVVSIVAPGRVGVQVSASYYVLGAGTYDATGQAVYGRVTPATAGSGGKAVQTYIQVTLDANNYAQLVCTPGTSFTAQVVTGGVTASTTLTAYDPTQHAWWRVRESAGSFVFEASPDGYAWTTLATMPYTWSAAAVSFYFGAGTSDGTTGSSAYLEHLSTHAGVSGMMPSWPQVRFQTAFNAGGTSSTSPAFVDLTSRLRGSWSADLAGRQYELDQVQSGQLRVTLWNGDGALDPTNTASPYAPNILPMRQCRLQAVWPPTRNLLPQSMCSGINSSQMTVTAGTLTAATGLTPAPTGHTTAYAWAIPAAATTGNTLGLGATSGGFPVPDPAAVPVVAGQSYTFTCWTSLAAGGDSTTQLAARISWYDGTGTRTVTLGANTSITVLGAWTMISSTVTAPTGAVCVRPGVMLASVPASATTAYVTAWQFEQAAAATPWVAGGAIYGLWQGFIERWPQVWNFTGTYGLVDLTCIDLLAGLAQFKLQDDVQAQLLSLGPRQMYPLDEPSGSVSFRDVTGQHPAATIINPPGTTGSIAAGSSITGTGFVGASGPVVTFTNSAPASPTGSYISINSPYGPPASGGWCRLICFRTTYVPASGNSMWLWGARSTGTNLSEADLFIDSSQHVHAQSQNSAGQYYQPYVPTVQVCDGNWHMAAMLLTADGKTLNVNVDGVGYQSSGTYDAHPTGISTDLIGIYPAPQGYLPNYSFVGDIAFVCEFPTDQIPSLSDIAKGFSAGWAGETSAARAQRILSLAGISTTLTSNDATTAMGGASFVGSDAMTALQVVANSEAGTVHIDGSGVLHLNGRLWRYLQNAAQVTFGENPTASEVPYLGDVEVDFDITHVYNTVSVTNQVAPNSTAQPPAQAQNTASQQGYFPRTLQRDINVQDQSAQQYQASYLASQYSQPLPRVAAMTVDGAANPALWSTILSLGFGARAQVNRRPPSGPGAPQITLQQFVEKLTWNGNDQGRLQLSMQMTPAQPYLGWWVVASLHSTLQAQAAAATNTITLGALTGASLNPAAAVLAAGTQLVVGYGTSLAETVTVLSVAATTAGYTSVVVTLTANLANTHAAGAVVCQPLPSGYQAPTAVLNGFPGSLDAAATLSSTTPRIAY